jgi:hypothetical protein
VTALKKVEGSTLVAVLERTKVLRWLCYTHGVKNGIVNGDAL